MVALGLVAIGCSKHEKEDTRESAAEKFSPSASIVEVYERGQIAWSVDAQGQVLARVLDDAGANGSRKASGTIEWNEGDVVRSAKLAYDDHVEALVATGPVPADDLNELRYTVVYEGEPVNGSLHVPRDGTAALQAEAKASASIDVTGAVAPHGGVVQVVGEDRVEIVADDDSDEVRVYVLDASWKPTPIGDRKITIAVGGAAPRVVVLVAADGYFVGHWKLVGQPRVTILIKRPGGAHVAIVGFHAGGKLHVAHGPKFKVKGPSWKGGPPAMVKIDVKEHGPKGKVKIKFK